MRIKGRLKSALPEGYINDINGSNAEIEVSVSELARQMTDDEFWSLAGARMIKSTQLTPESQECSCKTDIKNRTIEITDCPIHDKPAPQKKIEELSGGEHCAYPSNVIVGKINEIIKQVNGI